MGTVPIRGSSAEAKAGQAQHVAKMGGIARNSMSGTLSVINVRLAWIAQLDKSLVPRQGRVRVNRGQLRFPRRQWKLQLLQAVPILGRNVAGIPGMALLAAMMAGIAEKLANGTPNASNAARVRTVVPGLLHSLRSLNPSPSRRQHSLRKRTNLNLNLNPNLNPPRRRPSYLPLSGLAVAPHLQVGTVDSHISLATNRNSAIRISAEEPPTYLQVEAVPPQVAGVERVLVFQANTAFLMTDGIYQSQTRRDEALLHTGRLLTCVCAAGNRTENVCMTNSRLLSHSGRKARRNLEHS